MRSRKLWWGLIALYAGAVLVLAVIKVPEPDLGVPQLDKVAHLCEYLLFAWLLVQGIRTTQTSERLYLLWAWIFATSYGLLIELIQVMLPWRSMEWADAAANTLGAALGVWLGQRFPHELS